MGQTVETFLGNALWVYLSEYAQKLLTQKLSNSTLFQRFDELISLEDWFFRARDLRAYERLCDETERVPWSEAAYCKPDPSGLRNHQLSWIPPHPSSWPKEHHRMQVVTQMDYDTSRRTYLFTNLMFPHLDGKFVVYGYGSRVLFLAYSDLTLPPPQGEGSDGPQEGLKCSILDYYVWLKSKRSKLSNFDAQVRAMRRLLKYVDEAKVVSLN